MPRSHRAYALAKDRVFFANLIFIFFCFTTGYEKFNKLSKIYKALIVTGAATFLVLVVLAAVYFCRRNRATTSDQVKVKPPSYDEATSTKTKVPMQPLINEI